MQHRGRLPASPPLTADAVAAATTDQSPMTAAPLTEGGQLRAGGAALPAVPCSCPHLVPLSAAGPAAGAAGPIAAAVGAHAATPTLSAGGSVGAARASGGGGAGDRTVICLAAVTSRLAEPDDWRCGACGTTEDLWLCASCGHIGCGQGIAGHARAHWARTSTATASSSSSAGGQLQLRSQLSQPSQALQQRAQAPAGPGDAADGVGRVLHAGGEAGAGEAAGRKRASWPSERPRGSRGRAAAAAAAAPAASTPAAGTAAAAAESSAAVAAPSATVTDRDGGVDSAASGGREPGVAPRGRSARAQSASSAPSSSSAAPAAAHVVASAAAAAAGTQKAVGVARGFGDAIIAGSSIGHGVGRSTGQPQSSHPLSSHPLSIAIGKESLKAAVYCYECGDFVVRCVRVRQAFMSS
jgi:hypothetical protein